MRACVRACMRVGGHGKPFDPYKKFSFSGSLELDTTPKSPLTQPAMAPALD